MTTYYGTFSLYTPVTLPEGMPAEMASRVLWLRNEKGEDLYELRTTMPETGSFVTVNADGRIRVIHDDPHKVWPADNGRLYHVDETLPTTGLNGGTGLEGKLFDPDTGTITDPPPPRVVSVTSAQAKVALFRTFKVVTQNADGTETVAFTRDASAGGTDLLTLTQQALTGYPADVKLWFDNAKTWERENTYVLGIGLELGLSESEMDDLFTYAKTLSE